MGRDVDVKFNIVYPGDGCKSRELYLRLTRLIGNSWMSSSSRDTLFELFMQRNALLLLIARAQTRWNNLIKRSEFLYPLIRLY